MAKLPPVSTTPAANFPLVSTTLAANFATSFASAFDTSGKLQRQYEAIGVWLYTTFIVIEVVVNRKLAVKTYTVIPTLKNNNNNTLM